MKLLRSSMHMEDTPAGVITYELRRSRRRTLAIQVDAEGHVLVRAPHWASLRDVREMVHQRATWVQRKTEELSEQARAYQEKRRRMVHRRFYLGREYRLSIRYAESPQVWLGCDRLHVETSDFDDEAIESLLDDWYRVQARQILEDRLQQCLAVARPILRGRAPDLRLRKMRTQWGSCSEAGRITLNTELVKAPRRCIDYVILHELCHLRELNHSPRYYALLDQVMPGWESHKARLEELSVLF